MLATIAAALLALLLPLQGGAEGGVRGSVRDDRTGAPLPGAVVEVVGAGVPRGVAADSAGTYRLGQIPAGRRLLRARHLGYAPLEMEVVVPAGREVELDISLRANPLTLAPVRVRGATGGLSAADSIPAPSAELAPAGARAISGSPGLVELGLAEAARRAPGQEPVDPADVLYVRGTGSDLKLVFLDGAPVYAPFPLGGLLDAFTPNLLHSADVHLGGAPARYDGGLSYVLDLRTRAVQTDAPHVSGAADLLSARVLAETPLPGRSALLVSARTVHGHGVDRLARDPLPYGYAEGLVRSDVGLPGGAMLTATLFRNGEEVWLDDSGRPSERVDWGNTAGSLRFRGEIAGAATEVTASVGDFAASLPLQGWSSGAASGTSRHHRLSADFSRSLHGVRVRYGASYDRQRQGYTTRFHTDTITPQVGQSAEAVSAGGYLDLGWRAGETVRLRGGLRADHFSLDGQVRLAPRLAATWLVSERAALTLAAGRYHQYLRPPATTLLLPEPLLARPAQTLTLGSSSHLALSLDQELGEGLRLGIEGFYKSFENVPGVASSFANASGVDVWVRRSEGAWTGWMGYSLAWTWAVGAQGAGDQFAGRQLLTSGLSLPVGGRGKLDAGFVYGAGLPYSAIPLTPETAGLASDRAGELRGSAGSAPLLPPADRPYLRLDLAASRAWSTRWGGTPVEVAPYLRLLNTLGQRDALFYRFNRDSDHEPRALLVLPVVPVLGVEWKF